MIIRSDVVKAARSYLGVKFRLHGRDRTGLDCVGLLYRVLSDLGMQLPDYTDYDRQPNVEKLQRVLDMYSVRAPTSVPYSGQVLKIRQLIFPMHVAILAVEQGKATIIHANVKRQKVVEQSLTEWADLIIEHRNINGVR